MAVDVATDWDTCPGWDQELKQVCPVADDDEDYRGVHCACWHLATDEAPESCCWCGCPSDLEAVDGR